MTGAIACSFTSILDIEKMASCAYCNATILVGGKREGSLRFCSAKCRDKGAYLVVAQQVPDAEVERHATAIHRGSCPKCGGPGPVDVHQSYRVWSAIFITRTSGEMLICCRKCGLRQKMDDSVFSLALGWWGFPWGIVITPLQLIRNILPLLRRSHPARPSLALNQFVRYRIAASSPSLQRGDGDRG
ncbi:hypothetical protein [Paracidovorax avenae]|uniref:hypothetical protein n=1 Tax=Paracidovorax avenae TaxID=80867 RepID=UPI001F2ECBAB|nr:hypothetical protein [Paracidovorax avenae]